MYVPSGMDAWFMRRNAAVEEDWLMALPELTGSFDKPIQISPDWPPVSNLDVLVQSLKSLSASARHSRLNTLKSEYKWTPAKLYAPEIRDQ
jgi:hypothetical protein